MGGGGSGGDEGGWSGRDEVRDAALYNGGGFGGGGGGGGRGGASFFTTAETLDSVVSLLLGLSLLWKAGRALYVSGMVLLHAVAFPPRLQRRLVSQSASPLVAGGGFTPFSLQSVFCPVR